MAINRGGDTVGGGYYWNLETWDAIFVEGPVGDLPGGPNEIYRAIPTLVLLFAAPIMGAVFVMFLPFIGIALMLQHITRAAIEAAGDTMERAGRSMTHVRPVVAFLAGRAGRTGHDGARSATSPQRDALGKKTEDRREN